MFVIDLKIKKSHDSSQSKSCCHNTDNATTITSYNTVEVALSIIWCSVAFLYIAILTIVIAAHYNWCGIEFLFDYDAYVEKKRDRILKDHLSKQLITKVRIYSMKNSDFIRNDEIV